MLKNLICLILVGLVATGCDFFGPKPTSTRPPTGPTMDYLFVNGTQEARGLPTMAPGLDETSQSGTRVAKTVQALDALANPPTQTLTSTPRPTFTLIPSGTPVPGEATELFDRVNGTIIASSGTPNTPGPIRNDRLSTLTVLTVEAMTKTVTPTPTASPTS